MTRCRWCLDITSAGYPDKFHVDSERECPGRGKGEPYDGLAEMFKYTEKEVHFYRLNTNNFIKDDFPDYYNEMKERNEL